MGYIFIVIRELYAHEIFKFKHLINILIFISQRRVTATKFLTEIYYPY